MHIESRISKQCASFENMVKTNNSVTKEEYRNFCREKHGKDWWNVEPGIKKMRIAFAKKELAQAKNEPGNAKKELGKVKSQDASVHNFQLGDCEECLCGYPMSGKDKKKEVCHQYAELHVTVNHESNDDEEDSNDPLLSLWMGTRDGNAIDVPDLCVSNVYKWISNNKWHPPCVYSEEAEGFELGGQWDVGENIFFDNEIWKKISEEDKTNFKKIGYKNIYICEYV